MGSASTKFRKHLQNGEEVSALRYYEQNSDLRKALDPNSSYGDSFQHDTPLHLAAKHGMKTLLRLFLYQHGGNPNKTNARKETALHCVCMEKNAQFYTVKRRRAECLKMILQWKGATLEDGSVEKVNISSNDEKGNTSLHYAAASGLKNCVEILVQYGASLFLENSDQHTPCDTAEKNNWPSIALYLESKMVFSGESEVEDVDDVTPVIETEEYSGLRAQDLQEAKDQLLVETADMLSVPLFTAEALLRNHEWSKENLLEAWMSDSIACCEKCGVTPPQSFFAVTPYVENSLNSPTTSEAPSPDTICDICTVSFLASEEPVNMSCDHQFCRVCWKTYLNMKIHEGEAHDITCPGFQCSRLVPVDVIENIVSRDMARRYLQFDIKAFVDSNPMMKWCPYPGCARAVKLPDLEEAPYKSGQSPGKIPSDTSRAVDCGNGHYFCWECLGEAHEPCSCDNWKKWQQEISEVKPEELKDTEHATESAANCLWLVTNSKPCPNCKSPIQKNEGCNHMRCSKCKHDFCWVCLEPWKRHNSSTGGYFKCNRYEAVNKVEKHSSEAIQDAEVKNSQLQELSRFVHYYTRFKNHENSYKLEDPLLSTAKDKMMKLAEAVTDRATANMETKFVEDAVHQLLRARRVLKCSYVYGYYLSGPGYKKIVFEFMQTELEECTEILSQMVNRLYLRTPRKKIIEQAYLTQRKRIEFIVAISKGLVPPETPPSLKKKKKRKYSMDLEDDDLRKAILASIQDVDPADPWIKDASGRHTNVMAVLDWPEVDSDDSESEENQSNQEKCNRTGCSRLKATNPRTGTKQDFCSLRCLRFDQLEKMDQDQEEIPEVILDEHMDLLRALEMSRLQYLKDSGLINVTSQDDELESPQPSSSSKAVFGSPQPGSSSQVIEENAKIAAKVLKKKLSPMERLDIEIQRVLDMTSTLSKGFDDEDSDNSDDQMEEGQTLSIGGKNIGQLRELYFQTDCPVVHRVPNKNVEDLYTDENGTRLHSTSEDNSAKESNACEIDCAQTEGASASGTIGDSQSRSTEQSSMFGVIKDLSISNIHVGDNDKTKNFKCKNLSLLCNREVGLPRTKSLLAANTPNEFDIDDLLLISPISDIPSEESITDSPCISEGVIDPGDSLSKDDRMSSARLSNELNSSGQHATCTGTVLGPQESSSSSDDFHRKDGASLVEMAEHLLLLTEEMQSSLHGQLNSGTASNTTSPPSHSGDNDEDQKSHPNTETNDMNGDS